MNVWSVQMTGPCDLKKMFLGHHQSGVYSYETNALVSAVSDCTLVKQRLHVHFPAAQT